MRMMACTRLMWNHTHRSVKLVSISPIGQERRRTVICWNCLSPSVPMLTFGGSLDSWKVYLLGTRLANHQRLAIKQPVVQMLFYAHKSTPSWQPRKYPSFLLISFSKPLEVSYSKPWVQWLDHLILWRKCAGSIWDWTCERTNECPIWSSSRLDLPCTCTWSRLLKGLQICVWNVL